MIERHPLHFDPERQILICPEIDCNGTIINVFISNRE